MTNLNELGLFDIIYADPPWHYGYGIVGDVNPKNHYDTMTIDQLKALTIPAKKDAFLIMWATSGKLDEAIPLMNAWGFTYKSSMVWNKMRPGMGWYSQIQHEFLLIGKRGHPKAPTAGNRPNSIINAKRTTHSTKPHEVYDIIERMFPHLTDRLEMFARNTRPGWVSWGNEVPDETED